MGVVQYHHALNRPTAPVCSVCIANYNGVHMLAECLDSILAQDIDEPVEIIVHDDASTDDSVAFLCGHYPQVEMLASSENVGFCIANNRMVTHARGEYVLLLNNDAALLTGALRALLDAGATGSAVHTLPQYDWHSDELVDRGCLLDLFYNPVPNREVTRTDTAMVIGACLFIPRALWNELGGFPEWFGSIGEDLYLCCLARLRGVPIRVVPTSGYRHRQGSSFGGNRVDREKLNTTFHRRALSERNKTAVMIICTPTWLALPLLGLHCALLAVEGALLPLLKADTRIWKGIYGPALSYIFREFGSLRARRRDVQRTRQIGVSAWFKPFTWIPRKLVLLFKYGLPRFK